MGNYDTIELAYKYVITMSKTKQFNPQTVANFNVLRSYDKTEFKNTMEMDVERFCNSFELHKVRDFVYKSDYLTPRDMYLINPIFYTYYTCLVFELAKLVLKSDSTLDFSGSRIKIFYSGLLDIKSTSNLKKNATFNQSYKVFQKEREKYFDMPVLKIDVQDFFNSIKVKNLFHKLRTYLGNQKVVDDLEYFFHYCGFETLPQFHYSIASSILSQLYLMDFDSKAQYTMARENLMLIRFVDDMYIFHLDGRIDEKKNNSLLNELSFFLWEDELVLNSSKTKALSPDEYKKAFELGEFDYDIDGYSYSSEKVIEERTEEVLEQGFLIDLIEELCDVEEKIGVDLKKYKKLTEKYLSIDGEDTRKVINNIIFSSKWKKLSSRDLLKIISNWRYILFNPSQFTILYIFICRYLERTKKIEDGSKIKMVLNYLFRNEIFTFRDTLVAVSYLFQNRRNNKDLLQRVKNVNPGYVEFIEKFV